MTSVWAGEFFAFGPEDFVRTTATPVTVTRSFSVMNPDTQYFLRVENKGVPDSGAQVVTSSIISLNGTKVLDPSRFRRAVTFIELPVYPQANNTIDVELRSKPGGVLTVSVVGLDNEDPSIQILEPADGSELNETRPLIRVTFSDGISGIELTSFYAKINGVDSTSLFTVTSSQATCQPTTDLPPGGNVVTAGISDKAGNSASATSSFRIASVRAIPGAYPTSGYAPLTVHFTTNGEDPSGTIEVFRWDFDGDGSWDTYDTVARDYTHTYNDSGTYNATLYVQSNTGATATAEIVITVLNNPPIASADVVPSNGAVPLTVQLLGSGSDPDGHVVLYQWDFDGDGVYDWSSTTTGNTSHTYTAEGTYQAVFRVTDNHDLTGTATAVTTVVSVGPPGSPTATASANPASGDAPLTVNFNGTATDPDNSIVLYEWDFDGDGVYDWSSASSASTTHTYTQAGTHLVAFRVTDSTGLTGIDYITVFVNITASLSVANNTVGFLDYAGGITANASSQYSSSYSPAMAIDGSTSTAWYTAYCQTPYYGVYTYFEATFATPQKVRGLSVNSYYYYRITRGRMELYDNAGNSLYSTEADFPSSVSTFSWPEVENVSRIRLVALQGASYAYVMIYEFTVDSTPMPGSGDEPEPTGTNINTSISAGTRVSVYIRDGFGNRIRTLVNDEVREMGSYSDSWDCRDDSGFVVNDGLYYAILGYKLEGAWHELDLTHSTGGTRYSFPFGSGCDTRESFQDGYTFSPFDDEVFPLTFRLCKAEEVTAFIGPLWTGTDPARIRTIVNRKAFPAGKSTIYWDGLDDQGNVAQAPPGDSLITGFWRYDLPNNAIYMTGGRPQISDVTAEENYFSPFSEKCDEQGNGEGITITYTVSEDVAYVQLRVYSVATSNLVRTLRVNNVEAGEHTAFWNGKNNSGEYVDIGDYRVGILAVDAEGNESMLRYTLVRFDY